MLKNYFKIAWRNLLRNKSYTFINIAGLSFGLASALLIFALVRFHFSFDKHHKNYEAICRIITRFETPDGDFHTPGVPYPMGDALRSDFPEIEKVAMVDIKQNFYVAIPQKNNTNKKFKTDDAAAFVEPGFFSMFDFTWMAGNANDLKNPNTAVISKKNALLYFGTTDVIGRLIKFEGRLNLKVTGVFEDPPKNSDLRYLLIASYASLKELYGRMDDSFGNTNSNTQCFVMLNGPPAKAELDKRLIPFVKKYKPDDTDGVTYFTAQPLSEIHFGTDYGGVNKSLILSLAVVGVFLIITACINFINMATAQALNRAKEVGVRKVMGSSKQQLFFQFITETAFITLAASVLSLLLFRLAQPFIRQSIAGTFNFTFYFDYQLIFWLIILIVIVILSSGAYPALVLAGYNPVTALKGKAIDRTTGGYSIRRNLIIIQFSITQALIIGMAVVASQLNYLQGKDLGFKQDAILSIRLPDVPMQDVSKLSTFKTLSKSLPGVNKFSYSMSGAPQANWVSQTNFKFDNRPEEEKYSPDIKGVDADYLDLYDIKLVAGRNLYPSDTAKEALVNETFVKRLGFKSPNEVLGKRIDNDKRIMEIVGVVKDFNLTDLSEKINPLFMTTQATNYYYANIELRSSNFKTVIKQLEDAFNRVYPENYFDHQFVDEQVQNRYRQERTMSKMIYFFAAVSILIGCLGLYGLVSFMATQKRKEIGIRKVVGANVSQILTLFIKEFSRLIIVAFIIAAPIAYYVMSGWLENYAFRISINIWLFVSAISVTFLIALLTIGYKAIKAALANPVKSLRTE